MSTAPKLTAPRPGQPQNFAPDATGGRPRRPPVQALAERNPAGSPRQAGPGPDSLAERCLAGIHQVVRQPPSGQPPPGSQDFDCADGPPPFSGATRLYGPGRPSGAIGP